MRQLIALLLFELLFATFAGAFKAGSDDPTFGAAFRNYDPVQDEINSRHRRINENVQPPLKPAGDAGLTKDITVCAKQNNLCECKGEVRYGEETRGRWTKWYDVKYIHVNEGKTAGKEWEIMCGSATSVFYNDPAYSLLTKWTKECQCRTLSSESVQKQQQDIEANRVVGTAFECAVQGHQCECAGGRVRYGLETTWTTWHAVPPEGVIECGDDFFQEDPNYHYLHYRWKVCQCERKDTVAGAQKIPEGTKLYLFKVGTYEDHTTVAKISPRMREWIHKKANHAKKRVDDWYENELPKQIVVYGAGTAAGVTVSVVAAPIVLPLVKGGGAVAATSAVIGAATANYVATAAAKGGARYMLQTEDADTEMFNLQEAFISIAAGSATAGLANAGVKDAVEHVAKHANQAFLHIGNKIVCMTSESIVESTINSVISAGLEQTINAAGELTISNPDSIPTVNFEAASLGIIMNIMMSGVRLQKIDFGDGDQPEIVQSLKSLRDSALKTLQEGIGHVPDPKLMQFAIAENTLGRIFNPNFDGYETVMSGMRFPYCDQLRAGERFPKGGSRVPLCYCMRHGYTRLPEQGPTLGVDVDFCLRGQKCISGEGAENAKCVWQDEESKTMVLRLYRAFDQGIANCFGQHLNNYQCLMCLPGRERCMTEEGEGKCAPVDPANESNHEKTCLRDNERIVEEGSKRWRELLDNDGKVKMRVQSVPQPKAEQNRVTTAGQENHTSVRRNSPSNDTIQ